MSEALNAVEFTVLLELIDSNKDPVLIGDKDLDNPIFQRLLAGKMIEILGGMWWRITPNGKATLEAGRNV